MLWIKNKLETSKDALWKRKNFNTENWKPCTLDLSPCGKRNAEKSRLGHLWIVFYKSYPTLFALSHPFKPLVDYRLLCSQYNTGKTLEPACQRGLLLALKIAFFLSLKSITLSLWLILTTILYMMKTGQRLLYIAIIPHICHFIYTGILCGWNILHSKCIICDKTEFASKQCK